MKRHTIKDLDAILGTRRVKAAKARARQKMQSMLLGEVRRQLGFTQTSVANSMGVSQSALSQMESQGDLQLSTLRRLVAALGGELDIIARVSATAPSYSSIRNDCVGVDPDTVSFSYK